MKRFEIDKDNPHTVIDNHTGKEYYSRDEMIIDMFNILYDELIFIKGRLLSPEEEQEVVDYLNAYHQGDVEELKK